MHVLAYAHGQIGVVQSALECSKGFAPNSSIPPWVRVFAMLTGDKILFVAFYYLVVLNTILRFTEATSRQEKTYIYIYMIVLFRKGAKNKNYDNNNKKSHSLNELYMLLITIIVIMRIIMKFK